MQVSDAARSLPGRVLEWLKGAYPHGVPEHDYIALLGVLHRQLTDVKVPRGWRYN